MTTKTSALPVCRGEEKVDLIGVAGLLAGQQMTLEQLDTSKSKEA